MNEDLEKLRKQIDIVDRKLIENLAIRFEIVSEIKELKKQGGLAIRDENRERALLNKVAEMAQQQGFNPDSAKAIFEKILEQSRKSQEN